MQKLKTRNISVIALALLMIISTGASIMQTSYAHSPPWNLPTFAYIQVAPNPIGVGQTATVYMFQTNTYDNAAVANNYRFQNYELTITAPDGTTSHKISQLYLTQHQTRLTVGHLPKSARTALTLLSQDKH